MPLTNALTNEVSIPYERESLSKVIAGHGHAKPDHQFQFPTNGKAYPKARRQLWKTTMVVGFNSLRTGKPIQRKLKKKKE